MSIANEHDTVHVTLVRHGESLANRATRWQGQGDSPLSTLGKLQAERVGARLSRRHFDRVISSDLQRASDTARAIGEGPELHPGFRELDVGHWEGLTREEVQARFPEEIAALSRGEDVPLGGGESYGAFLERVDTHLREACAAMAGGERLLVVCHGGVIGAAVSLALGIRKRGKWPVSRVSNTAVCELSWRPEGSQLQVFNDDLHLLSAAERGDDPGAQTARAVAVAAAVSDLAHLRPWVELFEHRHDLAVLGELPSWARPAGPEPEEGVRDLRDWIERVDAAHATQPALCFAAAAQLGDWVTDTLGLRIGTERETAAPWAGSWSLVRGGERPVLQCYNADPRR